MSTTLTIRNLDEQVKQRLRVIAAQHGKSMEAEARDILSRAVAIPISKETSDDLSQKSGSHVSSVRGIWKGRFTTDEFMEFVRGD